MVTQLSLMEAIMDMLCISPIYFLGLVVTGLLLFYLFKKDKQLPKIRITISSILLYYYLCIVLTNVVGIPTISEFNRLTKLGESLFHPNLSFIPFVNGFSLEFILNIICFMPLGFLCPYISRSYEQIKKAALIGFGLSLIIEISQLFTLYRATDINDLIANTLGTIIGCCCFKLFARIGNRKSGSGHRVTLADNTTRILPVLITLFAFVIVFVN